jgi:hypothetical protein
MGNNFTNNNVKLKHTPERKILSETRALHCTAQRQHIYPDTVIAMVGWLLRWVGC